MAGVSGFGLALSGGGARAIVHAGILSVLDEAGLKPEIISGASMGAIIGALYADGVNPADMLNEMIKPELSKLPSWIGHRGGIGSLVVLREHLHKILKAVSFENLNIPLIISVTNLNKGTNELISKGKLIDWIVASASIPIVFQPVTINDNYYVDGGLTNNLPIKCLRKPGRKIIAIESNHLNAIDMPYNSIKLVLERSLFISVHNTVLGQLRYCDLKINTPTVEHFGLFDFAHASEIYRAGEAIGREKLPEIIRLLEE